MKQLFLKRGRVLLEDVPAPALAPGTILVEVTRSLISPGTETTMVKESGTPLVTKAIENPQHLLKVVGSIKVRGVRKTLGLIQAKLDDWQSLGYSCAGRVIAVGEKVDQFRPGDRVACAGSGIANHAEIVSVPVNLAVKVPSGVSDRSAAFVTLGAVAMHAVRRSDVRLGETVCVIGLGLVGQLVVQLLASAGCRVVGVDPDRSRVETALLHGMKTGAESVDSIRAELKALTGGMGVDATIVAASTSSSKPVQDAFEITRKKGKITIVGAVGMDLKRSPFYEREHDFLISCSYGPGRYDPAYEQGGVDYPYAYVRWTENRNMVSFLDFLQEKKVDVEPLVQGDYTVEDAAKAYAALTADGDRPLGVLLSFPERAVEEKRSTEIVRSARPVKGKLRIGVIGVGEFARAVYLPNLKSLSGRARISAVCSSNGAKALALANDVGAALATTDYHQLISSPDVDAVLISTRHATHARMAEDAIRAGKHVFLEKPMALEPDELNSLYGTLQRSSGTVFMVGFNRRFAPITEKLIKALRSRTTPLVATYRVNAGDLPSGSWVQSAEGGGRLRGEACHMIDFFHAITGSTVNSMTVVGSQHHQRGGIRPDENFSASFQFEDGSVCALVYTALGNRHLPKEQVEIHWGGKSAEIVEFSKLNFFGVRGGDVSGPVDKGHERALTLFLDAVRDGVAQPIPWNILCDTTRAAIDLDAALWGKSNEPYSAS